VADFHPHLGMSVTIRTSSYGFMPHPIFSADMDEVFGIEGGEALIYQLQDLATGELWALKVFKPQYRGEHVARSVAALAPYAHLPGLLLGNRLCLTEESAPDLIGRYPQLEYAVLMPWIIGRTWAGLLADRTAGEQYTRVAASTLALSTAQVLWELEAHHLAHTDIASGNVICLPDWSIALLDIENLYVPGTARPRQQSMGTPGYQHRSMDSSGYWRPDGDRFAGAILLAEMLSWWDPLVRSLAPDGAESLFQPYELQEVGLPRWQAMRDAIWEICPPALQLFDGAWASRDLSECPELGSWAVCLLQTRDQPMSAELS
jgi:hypothetical protein